MTGYPYPLERVAEDQRPLIAAFRDKGCKSFESADSVATARSNYLASCAANGLAADPLTVTDVAVPGTNGDFGVRIYDTAAETVAETAESRPVIVFFHGGGWVIGDLDTHDPVCRRLATLTGLPVVAVDYHLGPEFPFPAGHLDCRKALEWIKTTAPERGWDPLQLVTVGDSAGGGLANVLAFEPSLQVSDTKIVAQVPLYPMLDATDSSGYWQRVSHGFPLSQGTLKWFIANYVTDATLLEDPRVSPLLTARKAAAGTADPQLLKQPPALILSLGLDPLAAEALEYAQLLAMGGTEVELVHLPDHAHGLFTSAGKIATGEKFLERVADFIARHTRHS